MRHLKLHPKKNAKSLGVTLVTPTFMCINICILLDIYTYIYIYISWEESPKYAQISINFQYSEDHLFSAFSAILGCKGGRLFHQGTIRSPLTSVLSTCRLSVDRINFDQCTYLAYQKKHFSSGKPKLGFRSNFPQVTSHWSKSKPCQAPGHGCHCFLLSPERAGISKVKVLASKLAQPTWKFSSYP